eukprot:TRINITY_DN2410_c3_g1_i1.p1 TRINITY_DN2410_c3_g1~~TRINITY_DN2410_c3_g1_i1.p1  ORF type:complete len:745 (+),score=236.49 TRINITY_DN2410_c3_g1_i1:76-2235(+)
MGGAFSIFDSKGPSTSPPHAGGAGHRPAGGHPAAAPPPRPPPPPELSPAELWRMMQVLPGAERRAAQMLLGLAVGDACGLPFELWHSRQNRVTADAALWHRDPAAGSRELRHLVLSLQVERLRRPGPLSAYARTFSDDTVCTDLKMAAVVQCLCVMQTNKRGDKRGGDPGELLWRCMMSQYIAWATNAGKALFQGTGGFTNSLMESAQRPVSSWGTPAFREAGRRFSATWPEQWYLDEVEGKCNGGAARHGGGGRIDAAQLSRASYGNGAVMSLAPGPIVEAVVSEKAPDYRVSLPALAALSRTHRHPHAVLGAELMGELCCAILRKQVGTTAAIPKCLLGSVAWNKVMTTDDLRLSAAYPIRAFQSWLKDGDCTEEEQRDAVYCFMGRASADLARHPPPWLCRGGARMGQLLRHFANHDDDFADGPQRRLRLADGEEVRFSQRALNTVLAAAWCAAGAQSVWELIARVIYIGGDADTIGAVAGQIACPLLPPEEVFQEFLTFVALDTCTDRAPCAEVARAAALRYAHRAMLFSSGRWDQLFQVPTLVDPAYAGLTDPHGAQAVRPARQGPRPRVLWLDAAFGNGTKSFAPGAQRRREAGLALERDCDLTRASQWQDALQRLVSSLQEGKRQFNFVIMDHRRDDGELKPGEELLRDVSELCGTDGPTLVFLTPYRDDIMAAKVSSLPAKMVRQDRPQQLLDLVVGNPLPSAPARVPPEV